MRTRTEWRVQPEWANRSIGRCTSFHWLPWHWECWSVLKPFHPPLSLLSASQSSAFWVARSILYSVHRSKIGYIGKGTANTLAIVTGVTPPAIFIRLLDFERRPLGPPVHLCDVFGRIMHPRPEVRPLRRMLVLFVVLLAMLAIPAQYSG